MNDNTTVQFEQTPVWQGVLSVLQSGPKLVNKDISAIIHTEANDFNILKITELQVNHDYVENVYGSIHINFTIGLGDYVYKLYPFRDMLEVTIKKTPQKEDSGRDLTAEATSIRYRGILNLKSNPTITGDRITQMGYETLNQSQTVDVVLELQDRSQELLRVMTLEGGIAPNATPEQIISGLMVGECSKWLVDGKPLVQAFNIVKPDNTAPIANAHIPNMKVGLVPTYIQEKLLGVYNSGLGTHYQRYNDLPSLFVYSLYNTTRFDEDVERVVFYSVPEDRLSGIDRTFRKEGKILYIAVTGGRKYEDDSQISDLNEGVGIRIPDAVGVANGGADMTTNGPIADRARLNTEIGNRRRSDGVYYAQTTAPTSNPFKFYSQLAAKQVANMSLAWENSNHELIYPGMPCKYVFMDQNEYREVKGIILGKFSSTGLVGGPSTSSTYRESTILGVCLDYYEGRPETQPVQNSFGNF